MSFRVAFYNWEKLSTELYSDRKLSKQEFAALQLSERKLFHHGVELSYEGYEAQREKIENCVSEQRSLIKNPRAVFDREWELNNAAPFVNKIGAKKSEDYNFGADVTDEDSADLIPLYVKVALERGRDAAAVSLISTNLHVFKTAKVLLRVLYGHLRHKLSDMDYVVALAEQVLPKIIGMACFQENRSELNIHFGKICMMAMSKVVGECFIGAVLRANFAAEKIKKIAQIPMTAVGATALLPQWITRTRHGFIFTVKATYPDHSHEQISEFATALKSAQDANRLDFAHDVFFDTETLLHVFGRWRDADVRLYMTNMNQSSMERHMFEDVYFFPIKARCLHSEYFDYALPLIQLGLPVYCCVWVVEWIISDQEKMHHKGVALVQNIWDFCQRKLSGGRNVKPRIGDFYKKYYQHLKTRCN